MSDKSNYNSLKITVKVSILSFRENNNTIVYSPELEVYGYGDDLNEAINSFNVTLEEFLRYTVNKGSFHDELLRMGWKIIKKDKKNIRYKSPNLVDLISNNKDLVDIISKKEYQKINKQVYFPATA